MSRKIIPILQRFSFPNVKTIPHCVQETIVIVIFIIPATAPCVYIKCMHLNVLCAFNILPSRVNIALGQTRSLIIKAIN